MKLVVDLLELRNQVIQQSLILIKGLTLVENRFSFFVGHNELLDLWALRHLLASKERIDFIFNKLNLVWLFNLCDEFLAFVVVLFGKRLYELFLFLRLHPFVFGHQSLTHLQKILVLAVDENVGKRSLT